MNSKEFFATLFASHASEDGYLTKVLDYILTEGTAQDDYDDFKAKMDEIYEALAVHDLEHKIYDFLVMVMDYKSKFSENAVKYIVEKVKPQLNIPSTDKAMYEAYCKEAKVTFPYKEKPYLYPSGSRAVINTVKTPESKDFWKGYFDYAKKTLQKEKALFEQAVADPTHKLNGIYTIGNKIDKTGMNMMANGAITSKELAHLHVRTNLLSSGIKVNDKEFDKRITDFETLYNTTDIIITAKIALFIKSLFNKTKK